MVRSPSRPAAGVDTPGKYQPYHLFVEGHADAIGQLRIEERLQQRVAAVPCRSTRVSV